MFCAGLAKLQLGLQQRSIAIPIQYRTILTSLSSLLQKGTRGRRPSRSSELHCKSKAAVKADFPTIQSRFQVQKFVCCSQVESVEAKLGLQCALLSLYSHREMFVGTERGTLHSLLAPTETEKACRAPIILLSNGEESLPVSNFQP